MSTKYKDFNSVPSDVLSKRLEELSDAVVSRMKGDKKRFENEFTVRIPAELDRDADLVLSQASRRIKQLEEENKRKKNYIACLESQCGVVRT